jgi:hypothetical protein
MQLSCTGQIECHMLCYSSMPAAMLMLVSRCLPRDLNTFLQHEKLRMLSDEQLCIPA